ncbi:MAG TPA: coenzyme F420-0:L-glutamate ligase [Stellaceae bacterium]|nr:coenzyme F420-0:L-glutamate ligase [Stellaceae bacterium]
MGPAATLSLTALSGLPTIAAGADLAALIVEAASRSGVEFRSGDVLVVAQKIVSKAEGRRVFLADVTPSPRALALAPEVDKDPRLVELILQESREVLRARPGVIVVVHRLGFVLANAGIDASNVESEAGEEAVLLLPADPDRSAEGLRRQLQARTGAALGIVINDSFGRAWRLGTIGTAIGVAGLPALIDLRGTLDRSGRALRVTEIGAADELAAAASLIMGQAGEGRPVVHARGFPYPLRPGKASELLRPAQLDLFR